MKRAILALIWLVYGWSTVARGEAPSHLPAELAPLANGQPTEYLRRASDIPRSVVAAAKKAMLGGKFHLADAGGAWRKTDVVVDGSLPSRRLVWATDVKGCFMLHYEMGGIGYSTHFLVFSPEDKDGHRKLIWSAAGFMIADDLPSFFSLLERGKIQSDPRTLH